MSRKRKFQAAAAVIVILLAGAPAFSQQTAAGTPSSIQVSGSSEITVPADRAGFVVTITSRGASAAAVSTDNSKLVAAVKAAMQQAGLQSDEILRTRFRANPRWNYDSSLFHSRRSGFEAEYTITLRTTNLQRVGGYVDAALEGGATQVSNVDFDLADPAPLKKRALAEAVANAKSDAETMATGVGGRLGTLLEMRTGRLTVAGRSANDALEEVVVTASRSSSRSPQVDIDIDPSDVTISASVVGKWQYMERPN